MRLGRSIVFVASTAAALAFMSGCSGKSPVSVVKQITDPGSIEAQQHGNTAQLFDNGNVTDVFGTYQRTKIDPNSVKITADENTVFSKAEVEDAKNFIVDYVATEALDSIALDEPAQYERWKAEVAPKYFYPGMTAEILNQVPTLNDSSVSFGPILTKGLDQDVNSMLPQLIRDGGPRVANKAFGEVVEFKNGYGGSLDVHLKGSATFYADDEAVVTLYSVGKFSTYLDAQTGQTVQMSPEEARSQTVESYPSLSDGKLQASSITYDLRYTLKRDDENQWKIAGFSNLFEVHRTSWTDPSSASELHYRDEVKSK